MNVWERMEELQREIARRQFQAVYGPEPRLIRVADDSALSEDQDDD